MTLRSFVSRRTSRGVSLVELMVGVAIGLIGVVAIFQAVTVWTKHTQTTGSGSDAQVSGTLALFNIERDLKQAGHGFGRAATALMGCNVVTPPPPVVGGAINLRPVEIVQGAPAGAPDTIRVFYGVSSFFPDEGDFTGSTNTTKTLPRLGGFRKGDIAVVAGDVGLPPVSTCMMIEVTDDTDPNGLIAHAPVNYTSFYGGPAKDARLNIAAPPAFLTGKIYNLGDRPRYDVWTIDNNRVLARVDWLDPAAPLVSAQIADGVVNMKAQYGYDTNSDGKIDNGEWMAALPPAPDWKRVLAVRVAVLVRSRQFERNGDSGANNGATAAVTPTAANPTYFGGTPFRMTDVNNGLADSFSDVDAVPNNWRYYRYRVYERVIPLRNMLWGTYG